MAASKISVHFSITHTWTSVFFHHVAKGMKSTARRIFEPTCHEKLG